jgi:hypothetical protein
MVHTRRLAGGALAAASVLLAGCRDAQTEREVTTRTSAGEMISPSGDSADRMGVALVRVVNAAPTTDRIIVRSDPEHILATVEYLNVTPYQSIDRNWTTFEITTVDTGTYEPLATNREMLTDGFRYTLVVMRDNDEAEFTTRILRDEISDDSAHSFLRVVHAANGIDGISVVMRGGETVFDGINFMSEAGFQARDAWKGTLEIRSTDGNRLLLEIPEFSLDAGSSHTLVLTRSGTGKLETFHFSDAQIR